MGSKVSPAKLRRANGAVSAAPSQSAVGTAITDHLRRLQAERQAGLSVDEVVRALEPAVVALAGRGLLVSISLTRDQRSVRLSALIDGEWIEWFAQEPDEAEDLALSIVGALGSS